MLVAKAEQLNEEILGIPFFFKEQMHFKIFGLMRVEDRIANVVTTPTVILFRAFVDSCSDTLPEFSILERRGDLIILIPHYLPFVCC